MKRTLCKSAVILLIVFAALNLLWFGWRQIRYAPYTDGMEQTAMSTFLVPRFADKDADGFDYSVKYPDYLSLTGNLAVGFPGTDENPFTDGLIVWPKPFGGYEYDVILNAREDESEGFLFYIDRSGQAVDEEYRETAREYQDVIQELLKRAGSRWKL